MMKKMCPVCDLPVTGSNYCPRCRKFVKQPYMQEVDYYLNESHPVNEVSCEFHNPYLEADHHGESKPKAANSRKPSAGSSTMPVGEPARKSGVSGPMFFIILAVIIIMILFTALSRIIPYFIIRYDGINPDVAYEEAYQYRDFSEEEVRKAGNSCNGYSHFPADGASVAEEMYRYVEESGHGYTVASRDMFSDNYQVIDAEETISYYSISVDLYLEDEEMASLDDLDEDYIFQYMEINYDTASGELHEYNTSLRDEQASLDYLEHFLAIAETESGVSVDESRVGTIMEQVKDSFSKAESVYIQEGIFDISAMKDDQEIWVFVRFHDAEEEYEAL